MAHVIWTDKSQPSSVKSPSVWAFKLYFLKVGGWSGSGVAFQKDPPTIP